ncbi:MAG: hypothetical protein Q8S21_03135 [Candidatus Paracaedibacteraceae bacterium]|nr:hypothetical protein [Candidatus Paracaedibacteraceae bacterium]
MKLTFLKLSLCMLFLAIGGVKLLCASSLGGSLENEGYLLKRTFNVYKNYDQVLQDSNLKNTQNDSSAIRTRSIYQREDQDTNQNIRITRSMSQSDSQEDSQDNSLYARTYSEQKRYKRQIKMPSESKIKFNSRVSCKCLDKKNRKDKREINNKRKYPQPIQDAEWNTFNELKQSESLKICAAGFKEVRTKLKSIGRSIIESKKLTNSQLDTMKSIIELEIIIEKTNLESFFSEVNAFYFITPNVVVGNKKLKKLMGKTLKSYSNTINKNIENFYDECMNLDNIKIYDQSVKEYYLNVLNEIMALFDNFLVNSKRS